MGGYSNLCSRLNLKPVTKNTLLDSKFHASSCVLTRAYVLNGEVDQSMGL